MLETYDLATLDYGLFSDAGEIAVRKERKLACLGAAVDFIARCEFVGWISGVDVGGHDV